MFDEAYKDLLCTMANEDQVFTVADCLYRALIQLDIMTEEPQKQEFIEELGKLKYDSEVKKLRDFIGKYKEYCEVEEEKKIYSAY